MKLIRYTKKREAKENRKSEFVIKSRKHLAG
jgi:hypothetical protein